MARVAIIPEPGRLYTGVTLQHAANMADLEFSKLEAGLPKMMHAGKARFTISMTLAHEGVCATVMPFRFANSRTSSGGGWSPGARNATTGLECIAVRTPELVQGKASATYP